MKNLLSLLLCLVLIFGNFQANAEYHSLPAFGHEDYGRKVNAGVSNDKINSKNKLTKPNNRETINDINSNKVQVNDDDDDDKNDNYGSYGHDKGSETGSHRYFNTANKPEPEENKPKH